MKHLNKFLATIVISLLILFASSATKAEAQMDIQNEPKAHSWTYDQDAKVFKITKSVPIHPLDDTHNPYQYRYSTVDEWLYKNIDLEISDIFDSGKPKYQNGFHIMYVDENGYLIPFRDETKWKMGLLRQRTIGNLLGTTTIDLFLDTEITYSAVSIGLMPEKLLDDMEDVSNEIKYANYPTIPDWARERIFESVVFISNEDTGNQIAIQYTNQLVDSPSKPIDRLNEVWRLYDMEGNLIDSPNQNKEKIDWAGTGFGWDILFWEHHTITHDPENTNCRWSGRYLQETSSSSKLLRLYDYDGTKLYDHTEDGLLSLEEALNLKTRENAGYFIEIHRHRIQKIYELQQKEK